VRTARSAGPSRVRAQRRGSSSVLVESLPYLRYTMYPAPMAPTIMPIAVKTFPVPASRSIRYPIAPHTDGPASIVAVIANPVDIPAQESRGSGVRALEPAEYPGRIEPGANPAQGVWCASRTDASPPLR